MGRHLPISVGVSVVCGLISFVLHLNADTTTLLMLKKGIRESPKYLSGILAFGHPN